MPALDPALVDRLYRTARADRFALPPDAFAAFLTRSAARAMDAGGVAPERLGRHLESLHLEDLALACACAAGIPSAWDHFVSTYRPLLYRAADAIDPSGSARESADALYGELYGLGEASGARRSHFEYFHGRSSLSTWLRAVLAQRHVDQIRQRARLSPLTPAHADASAPPPSSTTTPTWQRYIELLRRMLAAVVATLPPRDRLRLRSYYQHDLTLAQVGALLGEHEATTSRNLERTRRTIRQQLEAGLRDHEGLSEAEIAECFAAALADPGPLDLAELLGTGESEIPRKESTEDRSR